ncbi:hypothetical protein [Rubellicoccus peritrichatus]|uniref:Heparinase II/III-like protein n=1 Tax=Rubellicoccus peritrichatus TaxID=3080537 RepID=A0AAQ3L913_9BACT|nr:hypothetical protein [Puniceicoccus sp. CR14]WOO39922.1 hypothetical protein RZN69_14950 [Puniceicoccus sp. CR14]
MVGSALLIRKNSAQLTLLSLFILGVLGTAQADNYNATDENGVRIFSEVPAPGVHPRVIMSPQDLQPWREEVGATYRGKTFFAKRFTSPRIDALEQLDISLPEEELMEAYPHIGPGTNHELLYATLDVIYHQDEERAKAVCKAVTNFARVVIARSKHHPQWGKITEHIGGIEGNSGIRTGLGELWLRGGADFALAYDYLYNVMTPEQRGICREALSIATKDLVCWGMNFPRGRGISNWYGYHGELAPMILAIEGEEGYRPDQWEKFSQMIRDWAEVHIYESGGSNEDGYTINTSMREGQFALIAMARRGENHYARPNIKNYFKWIALSLVPGEDTGETVGYSSNRVAPYESAPVLARWAMPGDPYVNYYFRQYKGADYSRQNRWQYAPWSTMLGMNWEDTETLPLDMGELDLPLTAVFPYQGLFITRSNWSDEASYLNMLARQDAWYDRHENVDRGRFVFAALGRRWAIDRPWALATQSKDHSLVHIDGIGQAEAKVGRGKAPNAQLIEHADVDLEVQIDGDYGIMSYAVMDLSNAYNWLWTHSWDKPGEGWEPETRTFEEIGWIWEREGQPEALHGSDNKTVPEYNFEGLNLWRKPNNPVEFCWRTGILVRGENPYAMIIDDVKKDDEARTYDWYMPIPDDVDFVPISKNQVMLVEKDEERTYGRAHVGSRRLLITFMGSDNPEIKMEEYASSISRGKAHLARRIVATRKGEEGNFRVVLYPFRTTIAPVGKTANEGWKKHPQGAELPQFSPANSNNFFIKTNGRKDAWTFTPKPDGRNRIRLQRGGKHWEI